MLDLVLFRVLFSLLVTAYLAWEDARTSFMNEHLLYFFVGSGALINLVFLPQTEWLVVFGVAVLIAVLGFVSYKTGQFGGGDVLLFLGLALWLPFSPFAPVPWPFVLSIFVASAALGSIVSSALYAWKLQKFKLDKNKKLLFGFLSLTALVLFLLPLPILLKTFFYLLLVSSVFYFTFREELLNKVIIKQVKLKEIEDEDVLALERIPVSKANKFGLEKVLTVKALVKLKKYAKTERKTTVPIYKDLPRFGPYVLAGLILCLLVGDLIRFLMF